MGEGVCPEFEFCNAVLGCSVFDLDISADNSVGRTYNLDKRGNFIYENTMNMLIF